MFKNIDKFIKSIKMNEKNIKLKNTASIITLVVEFIKVLTLLIFLDKFSTSVAKGIFIFSIIATITSIFILLNDDYKKIYKYIVLDLSSMIYLFSNIIGGILIELIILPVDKKLINSSKKEEKLKKIPNTLYHKKIVYLYLFLSILIAYQYLYIQDTIFYILVFTTLVIFFKDDIMSSIKEFNKNISKYLKYIINNYLIMIVISNILFMIVGFIVGAESTNEQVLNQDIFYSTILAIFYAPLAEELLFRGCLRKLIKKDIIFILVSGISFGAWHVIGYEQSLLQYLYIIPYSVIGIMLSKAYAKSNNLTTNVGIHALNNILASILPIIL